MMTILSNIIFFVVISFLVLIVWESTMALHERKVRRRMGLTDYYDNPIKQEDDDEQSK